MQYYYQHPLFIAVFVIIISAMLVLDLGFFNKNPHKISNKEAVVWSAAWISLSMAFSLIIYKFLGFKKFTDYQSAYWIEEALSVDNLFVFILVFRFFKLDKKYHHKFLFWGILGALFTRDIFIFSGIGLINLTELPPTNFGGLLHQLVSFNIVMALLGLLLIITGYKSAFSNSSFEESTPKNYEKSLGAKNLKGLFKIIPEYEEGKFLTRRNGVCVGTQLLIVLGVIEFTDLLFAVDSVPAIFAITKDPFILYTSNIFAILGLRSLYFLLANFIYLFHYLKYGLGLILGFIGIKMLISPFIAISSATSLIVVGCILLISTLTSLIIKKSKNEIIRN